MKILKVALSIVILIATASAFAYYIFKHPAVMRQLGQVTLLTVGVLIALYGLWFWALVLVTRSSLRLYGKVMAWPENILFNAYSSLINFFGPWQSGPAFRGLYLKQRHA